MKKLLLAALALNLFACFGKDDTSDTTDTDADTDTDTDTDTDAPSIDVVSYGYDATEWEYGVDCLGWFDAVTMFITQDTSSPWEEDHELTEIDFDQAGAWDNFGITLPITDDWQAQQDSVNTLFGNSISCANPYCEGTMVWRVEAYIGADVVDCVVWAGSDADVSIVMESGCREITF